MSHSIIGKNTIIPNPLGPFINKKSSFTWIKDLKQNTKKQIFVLLIKRQKISLEKEKEHLLFKEVKKKKQMISYIYFNLHLQTTRRKGINNQNLKYFEYIFLKVPRKQKYFMLKKIISINSFNFALYKNNASYWTNVSDLKGLQFGANYFCMWKAIEYFKKINIEYIDFGEGFFTHENKDKLFLNHFKALEE